MEKFELIYNEFETKSIYSEDYCRMKRVLHRRKKKVILTPDNIRMLIYNGTNFCIHYNKNSKIVLSCYEDEITNNSHIICGENFYYNTKMVNVNETKIFTIFNILRDWGLNHFNGSGGDMYLKYPYTIEDLYNKTISSGYNLIHMEDLHYLQYEEEYENYFLSLPIEVQNKAKYYNVKL